MKRCICCGFTFLFVLCAGIVYGQAPTQAEALRMARRIRTMTPAQILKFRDSLMKAVTQQQAQALPNGNQLLAVHHYDTTYTTVRFNYTKLSSQHRRGGASGSTVYRVYGKSAKAPMLYEANGHVIVQCNMTPPVADASTLDQVAVKLKENHQYMTPSQAAAATDISRQMSFSSLALNDNSLTGMASENGQYSGNGGTTAITTKPPVKRMMFSFMYDPVQVISTVAAGADINIHTVSSGDGHTNYSDDAESIGVGTQTDPRLAKMVGGGAPQSNPDDAYMTVTKTARGFKIQYTKTQHDDTADGDTKETFTADIGEPDQQYEAVIKPYKFMYEHWIPKGPKVDGSDDRKGDDSARFMLVVRDKNDTNKLYAGNYKVTWKLRNISAYQGFNSNYPLLDSRPNKKADMKMSDSLMRGPESQSFSRETVTDSLAVSKDGEGNLAVLRVMCLDYGAWAKVKADVTLDNGTELTARPYYDEGKDYLTLPYDLNNNKIADEWEKREHIFSDSYAVNWDEDVKPDNRHNGDNIPLIDEYRGFLVEDDDYKPVYKRLSPQVKELFTIGLADKTKYGAIYKTEIKAGALGYGKISGVRVYHFTQSKYAQREPNSSNVLPYDRWVNYNSPTRIITHEVAIYAFDDLNPNTGEEHVDATTYPVWSFERPGYQGAQVPDDTEGICLYTANMIKYGPYLATDYLPDRPQGNDAFNRRLNSYIKHTNNAFHLRIDTLHLSDVVARAAKPDIARLIVFTVAHELCHATNIHHHHIAEKLSDKENYAFKGVSTCPVRYWLSHSFIIPNTVDWEQLYIVRIWNPATFTTPYGPADMMKLCTVGDNCFGQMKLKNQ